MTIILVYGSSIAASDSKAAGLKITSLNQNQVFFTEVDNVRAPWQRARISKILQLIKSQTTRNRDACLMFLTFFRPVKKASLLSGRVPTILVCLVCYWRTFNTVESRPRGGYQSIHSAPENHHIICIYTKRCGLVSMPLLTSK